MTLSVAKKERQLLNSDEGVYVARLGGKLIDEAQPRTMIDLFAGAGGLTLGFTRAFGHIFQPVWANDFNEYAVATYNRNFGDHCVCGDLVDILNNPKTRIPKVDLVVGGPPCQGFSLLNKNRVDDPRKQLWRPYLNVVKKSGATVFVMENVPQLLGTVEHNEIMEMAKRLGFRVTFGVLNAVNYGAPQKRSRAFIIGCKFADPATVFPPRKTHVAANGNCNGGLFEIQREYVSAVNRSLTVRDAIADLPDPIGTEIRNDPPPLDLHFGRTPTPLSRKRYRAIPDEGMNRFDLHARAPELTPECWIKKKTGGTDLFGRLWWDKPAFTIRTEFFKPEKGRYLHPSAHRPITHREAARFQTFPDSFKFVGSKIEIAKQIGNAVPPVLAARVADCVYALFSTRDTVNVRQIFKGKTK